MIPTFPRAEPVVAAALAPVVRLPLGVLAGVLATLAMDVAAARLPEGRTPPTVAAGVLTRSHPDAAPARLAAAVHYLAGGLTGPLFVWLLLASERLVGGPSPLATGVAAAVLFVLMVTFFVGVVLPRAEGLPRQRVRLVARDWTLSAAAYLAVLVPVVAVASGL